MERDARYWPEHYVAGISLTYDGSTEQQIEEVVPLLDRLGLKATFFCDPTELIGHVAKWREAALSGHEIGNGFLYSSVDEDGLIPDWPSETFAAELEDAEGLISEVAPDRKIKSFAMPCVRTFLGDGGLPIIQRLYFDTVLKLNESILEPLIVGKKFDAVRRPQQGFNDPATLLTSGIECLVADDMGSDSLATASHIGISQGAWVVLAFNANQGSELDINDHAKYLEWAVGCREGVEVQTFGALARMLTAREDVRI
jgi:hypothetical protein